MMSDPPSRLCLIPLTVFMTSFVAPLFPLTFPVVAAFAALPSPKRFDRKPPPPAPMAVKAWRLRGDGGSDEGSLRSTPMRGGSTCWNAAADRADDEEDNMVGKSCPETVVSSVSLPRVGLGAFGPISPISCPSCDPYVVL